MKYILVLAALIFGFGVYMANSGPRAPGQPSPTPTLAPDPSTTPSPLPGNSTGTPTPTTGTDIILTYPKAGDTINSPVTLEGQARGTWFFEATFPVILTDWDGRIIAESFATAQGDWMTEEFVPFQATLEFETPEISNRGSLILQKANPSGLPEHDAAEEITVFFPTDS